MDTINNKRPHEVIMESGLGLQQMSRTRAEELAQHVAGLDGQDCIPAYVDGQFSLILSGQVVSLDIQPPDFAALQAFYKNLGGENWFNHSGWFSSLPLSEWAGLTVENGRVTEIRLISNNLIGDQLPVEIAQMTELRVLMLQDNEIYGPVPVEITMMPKLANLQLYENKLSGVLPDTLLDSLLDLRLGWTEINSDIPAGWANANLKYLYVPHTQIRGPLPSPLAENILAVQGVL